MSQVTTSASPTSPEHQSRRLAHVGVHRTHQRQCRDEDRGQDGHAGPVGHDRTGRDRPRAHQPGHAPVFDGNDAADDGDQRQQEGDHGQPVGQVAGRGEDQLRVGVAEVGQQAPSGDVDQGQHRPQEDREDAELEVDRRQVAQVEGDRIGPVLGAAGDQVAAVGAQPPGEPARARVGKRGRHEADLRSAGRAREQPTQGGADVAAAGDGREQVEAKQQLAPRQGTKQAEAEGGAADPAARTARAPRSSSRREARPGWASARRRAATSCWIGFTVTPPSLCRCRPPRP